MRGFKIDSDYIYALENLITLEGVDSMTMSANAMIDPQLLEVIRVSPYFEQIIQKLPRHHFLGWRRAGSLNDSLVRDQPLEEKVEWRCGISCASTPFYDHNVMLPDGRVVLCCMDYGIKHVMGNILEQRYLDLFWGNELKRVKAANMSLDPESKKASICTACTNVRCYQEPN